MSEGKSYQDYIDEAQGRLEMKDHWLELKDQMIKTKAVLEYCDDHIDQMWAAKIAGILLGCDFRDAKNHLKEFYEFCEEQGI